MRRSRLAGAILVVVALWMGLMPAEARAQDSETNSQARPSIGMWRLTAAMNERREYAGGVRLKDGRILAVSGHPLEGKSLASAELYDPEREKWSDTGSLREARNGGNSATLLLDGRVLLAGGHSNSNVIRGAEVFDPANGTWSDAGNLVAARDPMATLLADGRVLLSGGIDWHTDDGTAYADTEIFDPLTGKWTATGSLSTPRYEHRAVRLDDGRVLAIGGYEGESRILSSTEIYDPATGRWEATGALPEPRAWFGHVKLNDGRVLVVGGYTGGRNQRTYLATTSLFDPKQGSWSAAAPMQSQRAGFTSTLLSDGQVLVTGGVTDIGAEFKTAELFDPRTETWRAAAPMSVPRRNHRATLLPNGSVLVIGGSTFFGRRTLTSCEIFSL